MKFGTAEVRCEVDAQGRLCAHIATFGEVRFDLVGDLRLTSAEDDFKWEYPVSHDWACLLSVMPPVGAAG
jgi:hypothetical protein